MTNYSSRYGSFFGGGFRPFGPGVSLNGKASEPIQSRAEDYRSPGDNSSPAGQKIPAGGGTCSYDGKIIWWNNFKIIDGKVTASFAMLFGDCIFTDSFALLKLFADEQLIISNQAPKRQSGQTIRFYDGTQTEPDPLLTSILGADVASVWPGYVYAVFEDFDCSPYGNRVPLIRAVISGAVTEVPATEEQSTLSFGATDSDNYSNYPLTVDRNKGHHYQFYFADDDDAFVSVIDIASATEISRAAIFPAPFGIVENTIALDGSEFVACTTYDASNIYVLSLLNAYTGEVVDTIPAIVDSLGTPYEPMPRAAVMIESGAATKYLVFCSYVGIGDVDTHGSYQGVAVANVTAGTIEWITHPYQNPLAGTEAVAYSLAIGPVADGQVTIWYTDTEVGGLDPATSIYEAVISATGATSQQFYASSDMHGSYPGVAYNSVNDTVIAYLGDGSFRKLNRDGTVAATFSGSISDFNINVGHYSFHGFFYRARPGYVIAARSQLFGDVYEIDLSDGSASLVIEQGDFSSWDSFKYFDQITGVQTEGSETPGVINKVTLGDLTPDSVDLVDLFTQTAVAAGFSASDLVFSNFPGAGVGLIETVP